MWVTHDASHYHGFINKPEPFVPRANADMNQYQNLIAGPWATYHELHQNQLITFCMDRQDKRESNGKMNKICYTFLSKSGWIIYVTTTAGYNIEAIESRSV